MQLTARWPALTFLGLNPTGDLGPLTGYTSKRGKPVWFLKSPPTSPPTAWQTKQRNLFRQIARHWNDLTPAARANWQAAASRAHLNVTGYNLFVYFHAGGSRAVIATVEHQSGIDLLPYS